MLYNAVLISTVQQCKSVICIHISLPPGHHRALSYIFISALAQAGILNRGVMLTSMNSAHLSDQLSRNASTAPNHIY